jgi:hypothetical protein
VRTILFASVFAALSVPVLAQESVTVEGQKNPDDEVVCVHSEPPLGSHIGGGKECHTKGEWKERERYTRQSTRDFGDMVSRGGSVNMGSLGNGAH